ncbi:MAG: hypothetical protein ABEJ43_01840 [Haloferacaceae archaeon]
MSGGDRARDRAATPVVGKAMEIAVLVLLTALLTAAMFGSVVPAYRSAAGAELADRTLARSAEAVERAVPAAPGAYETLSHTERVDLPDQIRGSGYVVAADGERLRLDHPRTAVDGSVRPALPNRTRLDGSWRSDRPARLRVTVTGGETVVRLVGGSR